jgi:hypothetical protein
MPLALFLWLFGTPQRNRTRRAREPVAEAEEHTDTAEPALIQPDQAGHAPGGAVAPVGKEVLRIATVHKFVPQTR